MIRWYFAFLFVAVLLPAQQISGFVSSNSYGRLQGIARDAVGNIYAADFTQHRVWRFDAMGAPTLVAGTGQPGFSGDDGPATSAELNQPCGLVVARDGSLYISEFGNQRIRRVLPNGTIRTIAGLGERRFAGDGAAATLAPLNQPCGLAIDAQDMLYVADTANRRIRRIDGAGIITTVAGTGAAGLNGDGGSALFAALEPKWLAVGADGSLYFSNLNSAATPARIRRRAPNGIITSVAGNNTRIHSGDGGQALTAGFESVEGLVIDEQGVLFVADDRAQRIRRIATDGIITTVAGTGRRESTGDGALARDASLFDPVGLLLDPDRNIFLTEPTRIRRINNPPAPVISSTNSAVPSFGGRADFSTNSYIEIYGTNLADNTRVWSGADFRGTNAPTTLDNVQVLINRRPAFVYFISPTQINVNAPEDAAIGPVSIQVLNGRGSSNMGTANRARVSPTLHSTPQFTAGGRLHVVAQSAAFDTYIGPSGMLSGVNLRAARAGETLIIFALGCGPTRPLTNPGSTNSSNAPLLLNFELRVGGRTARVPFAGAVQGTIGLYQFNVVVPETTAGAQPIELTIDGVPNNQSLVLEVGAP
jgi:uncharacterized protein (TIGR03437 family)